ncbi:RNA helicase [Sporothrix stenoceras]|uniref:RNA helicase n=1 Tax=Sporothrix stenoceras TaxID=5173 RepID=A0ABR3Z3U0_9PEZI
MLRAALGPICPICRTAATGPSSQLRLTIQQAARPSSWQTQSQTTVQLQKRFMASPAPRRKIPSRMVLSDNVARPPPQRHQLRRREAGPFTGMNRTVANIRERPVSDRKEQDPATPTTTSRHASRRMQDERGGGRGRKDNDKKSFKALRMQQSLATIGYGQRTQIRSRMAEMEQFDQFNLLPSIQKAVQSDALRGMVDIKPTPIQRLAIPMLLGQTVDQRQSRQAKPGSLREYLLAAETGSGKTLAYLLPAIDAVKRSEAEDQDIIAYRKRLAEEMELRADPNYRGKKKALEPHPTTARPRVIVLVPSAELVGQVGKVAKALSHEVKFRTELVSANVSPKAIDRNLHSPSGIDVVVATPHLLASISDNEPYFLSRVSHLIIDEADSLFDRSFSESTTAILERARPSLKQLILCSATIPRRLDTYLATHFPNMQRITTPNLHAIPRRVQLGVIDVTKEPYRNNKNLACADAIWSIGKDAASHEESGTDAVAGESDVKRIMVFVNEREKTQEVAEFLRSKGIDAVALHRDSSDTRHSEMLSMFTSAAPLKAPTDAAAISEGPRGFGGRTLPNTKVIVATDLASRGIDTLGVRHVVLYDVPHTTIDFIHRLGRAGRMGRRGRGIVLVGKDDRRDVVAEVRESMYMGQALV